MKRLNDLSPAYIISCLHYDEKQGIFLWKHRSDKSIQLNARMAGTIAGFIKDDGYVVIRINGRNYQAHRLAWVIKKGKWPEHDLDHKDNNKANNRWTNLRPATSSQNAYNQKILHRNKSGFKGVCYVAKSNRYHAYIAFDGKNYHLGSFRDLESARNVREDAMRKHHGEFARIA